MPRFETRRIQTLVAFIPGKIKRWLLYAGELRPPSTGIVWPVMNDDCKQNHFSDRVPGTTVGVNAWWGLVAPSPRRIGRSARPQRSPPPARCVASAVPHLKTQLSAGTTGATGAPADGVKQTGRNLDKDCQKDGGKSHRDVDDRGRVWVGRHRQFCGSQARRNAVHANTLLKPQETRLKKSAQNHKKPLRRSGCGGDWLCGYGRQRCTGVARERVERGFGGRCNPSNLSETAPRMQRIWAKIAGMACVLP